jgi:hypothetical protein
MADLPPSFGPEVRLDPARRIADRNRELEGATLQELIDRPGCRNPLRNLVWGQPSKKPPRPKRPKRRQLVLLTR